MIEFKDNCWLCITLAKYIAITGTPLVTLNREIGWSMEEIVAAMEIKSAEGEG